jgi:peroxiredoxin family protein
MTDLLEMTKPKAVQEMPKQKVNKMLIICSKGKLEDVYAALILANGALMEGIQAKMFFTFFGLEAISKKNADHMPTVLAGLPGFEAFASLMMKKEMDKLDIPHVREFLEMIDAAGGEIYACKLAADMFHLTKEDLVPEVKDIITVGDMYALADGEGTHILYI